MDNYFGNRYPYTDFHELNLDWIIRRMRELEIDMDEFKVVNNITFSGQWDITKQYPAWTIVSDNNIGYVSQKPVPVGVPLTNGNYWVEVIDYTAQIAGLETRVINLENTVGDSSSGLVHDVNELQSDVTSLDTRVSRLEINSILCIGDSYGNGAYNGVNHVNEGWVKYLQDYTGITCHNYCVSGAGIDSGGGGTSYYDEMQTAKGDDIEADVIVLSCGSNDYNAYTTVLSNLTNIKNSAKNDFNNAKLYVFWSPISYRMTQGEYLLTYKAYKDACTALDIPFASVTNNARTTDNSVDTDGVHLYPNGYKAQGYDIGSYILHGFIPDNTFYFADFKMFTKDFRMIKFQNDSNVHIRNNFIYFDIHPTSSIQLNSADVLSGTVDYTGVTTLLRNMFNTKGAVNFNNNRYMIYPGTIAINGVVSEASYEMIIAEDVAYLKCTAMNMGGWAFKTITSTDTVNGYLYPNDITIPVSMLCN